MYNHGQEQLFNVIDNLIFTIRKNLSKFDSDFNEIAEQLYKIENMRLAQLPEKYILQKLVEDNNILIQSLEKLDNNKIVKRLKDQIKEIEN